MVKNDPNLIKKAKALPLSKGEVVIQVKKKWLK